MQRLQTRAQFAVAMAGSTISRTAHFALHRAALATPPRHASGREVASPHALFVVQDEPWIGAVLPKRWAKRAVTRNGMKRQIYTLSQTFESQLSCAAHVVRLRAEFARAQYPSAWSAPLKAAVRGELQQLFERAAAAPALARPAAAA